MTRMIIRLVGAATFGTISVLNDVNVWIALGLFGIAYFTGALIGAEIGKDLEE
jgi:hypothetical protein